MIEPYTICHPETTQMGTLYALEKISAQLHELASLIEKQCGDKVPGEPTAAETRQWMLDHLP